MVSQCPQCQHQIDDPATPCKQCGWSPNGTVKNPRPNNPDPTKPNSKPAAAKPATSKKSPRPAFKTVSFEQTLHQAMELIEHQDYAPALKFLNQAIQDAPTQRLAECYSVRGFAHLKNLDFVRAEDDCTEAIDLNWQQAQTYAWRAAARGEQNNWRLAFDDLDRACEVAGSGRDQYLALMESYAETASEYFREQITHGNDSADLFFERGWIYLRCGKYQKSERDFQHAFARQPGHPWASVGLAELLLHQSETAGVRELCEFGLHGGLNCRRRALEIRAQLNHATGNIGLAQADLDLLTELADDEPHHLVNCARLRSKIGDHVTAIDELTQVLNQSSEHYLAFLVRGDCFAEIRNYGLAIEDYSRYLRFNPNDVRVLVRRARMFLGNKRWLAVHADLDKALGIDKTDYEAHLVRAQIFLAEEKLNEALNECRTAVRLDNHQAEAFGVLATIYNRLCDYGNAIEEFSRSIELAETSDQKAQFSYLRGIAHYELGSFDKALKDFKSSCKIRPNHAGSWIWKAATCARLEEWTAAILGLQTAISVRPSASLQYQQMGRPVAEKAIEFFNRQHQRGNHTAGLFRNRGLAHQFLGQHQAAITDYSRALKLDSKDVETLIRRGQAFTEMDETESANDDFTSILRREKNNHRARYCRAIARLAQGNFDGAQSDLKKAIRSAPDHPRYHILLGELLQKMSSGPEVVEAFDHAIRLDPTNPNTYRSRGAAHSALGQNLGAINDYTRCLELQQSNLDVLVQRGQTYLKINQPWMALEDFELALTHNPGMAQAYSGRAAVLVSQERHEYTLIWLTKAIHRFSEPRKLAEIVFARGKVFYQMGRMVPAISDFSIAIDLMKNDVNTRAAARYARAVAEVHNENFDAAEQDLRQLLDVSPMQSNLYTALDWLADRTQPIPLFMQRPPAAKRPTRPPVVRQCVELLPATIEKWTSHPPYDLWIVRTRDKKEYGPVHLKILETWAREGRLNIGMKLLRSDWSKWKRLEKILPEISPLGSSQGMVDDFPELKTRPVPARNLSSDDA